MAVAEIVGLYYDAWQTKHGDFSAVPLAEDFVFTGPVASFADAAGYRAMARDAGPLITKFSVRCQFIDGNRVCSIIDWEMALPIAPMTSAEILDVEDGKIVRGELISDAQELRAAMAQAG
ncbi:MAG: nuclear transport factor 2 family protein [Nocardiopsaceae bacterium]|jgi:ketosteroid isomerase-like protein|nr:nuclear transport factor 2 family protein [Nocardiopsaceae bacterium]